MNKLFAVIMSLQLIIAPVALAQTTSATSNGDQFRANPDAKGKGSYTKQILGMGIGIVGSNALVSCSIGVHPSILIFSAGSLIYIMSELLGGKSHNDYLKKRTEDVKMIAEKMKNTQGGEVQKEALQSALDNEKQILKFINGRKMWFTAVTVMFAAATAGALLEWVIPIPAAPIALVLAPCNALMGIGTSKLTAAALAAAFSFGAGGGMMGSFAAALLVYATVTSGPITAALMSNPGRVAVFAASTLIVSSILSDMSSKAKTAQANINLLQKALDEFKANSTPTNGLATDSSTSGSTSLASNLNTGNSAINLLPTSAEKDRICASSSSNGIDISNSACKNPLKVNAPVFDASLNVPTLNSVGQTIADVGNSLANGNLAGAEVGAANLASQAGRINEIRDNLLKQVNSKLVANGKKPLDLNASNDQQFAALAKSIGANDPAAASAFKNIVSGNGKVALGDDLKGEADLKENKQQINSTADAKAAGASTPATSAAAALAAAGYGGLSEGNLSEGLSKANAKSMDQALNEFESNESDVSKNSETSLFKQLSNRYLLNYNKIFERKKVEPLIAPKEE